MSIRIGILGYGNLGRGVECAIRQNPDMELAAVFTRRAPETVKILTEGVKVYHVDEAEKMKDEIDVLILCGGSATDLPEQTPEFAQWFNVVDSFDTHANVNKHFAAVDEAARKSGTVGIISYFDKLRLSRAARDRRARTSAPTKVARRFLQKTHSFVRTCRFFSSL